MTMMMLYIMRVIRIVAHVMTPHITSSITRLDLESTIQGWPLSKGRSGVHYPRVATIPESAKSLKLKLGQDGDQGG